jgi:hypothetical protein
MVSNYQTNKAMPGPNALKLPREPVSGFFGLMPTGGIAENAVRRLLKYSPSGIVIRGDFNF